jgi:putative membrane-bound dehydrogenase-like protein
MRTDVDDRAGRVDEQATGRAGWFGRWAAWIGSPIGSLLAGCLLGGWGMAEGPGERSDQDLRDPSRAVAMLAVHPGLELTLASSEPQIQSLTCLDIDHRGRVWACEVVNYRGHNGRRPEGDRILILEDQTGDGVMDSCKVFYQGRDIDSAMGICVLGSQVIVSASPNIWLFTDEDGDDVPDRKELLFSNTGIPQHDHSAHSFLFGPDGKLYWNFGNTGHAVHDASGSPVVDLAGRVVNDSGQPYREGMVFRCNPDGSEFEVLAHNFRNNYEVSIDAFGRLWQSDNDDDGNRAARINYVMEFGNYGYKDELTGAGWRAPRANMEATIPQQHWRLNDPGVVPTLLITGAGSPAGMTLYEGDLLPSGLRNQMIHCEPGLSLVRAYPVEPAGAGFTASMVNLVEGVGDPWFRPVDVGTAPDGSLFIADWYDPGVGGHQMGDLERGRLYRLAPAGHPYQCPEFDFDTPSGAVAALVNPNLSVRFMAWQAISRFGDQASGPLWALTADANPRLRARAYWALGKLAGSGEAAVKAAGGDREPEVREMAIRLARQLALPLPVMMEMFLEDDAPGVLRELAIACRGESSPGMPRWWSELAARYDGEDRWYLEALGIGAEQRWGECFVAYEQLMRERSLPLSADLVWRARTAAALPYVVATLTAADSSLKDVARFQRSLDFHSSDDAKNVWREALERLLEQADWSESQEKVLVEALRRSGNPGRYVSEPRVLAALERYLERVDRSEQLAILKALPVLGLMERLMALAAEPDTAGVGGASLLLERYPDQSWGERLVGLDEPTAVGVAQSLSSAEPRLSLIPSLRLLEDESLGMPVRVAVAKGLAGSQAGGERLLELESAGRLPAEARLLVGSWLRSSPHEAVRERATELFPALRGEAAEPLPPLEQLIGRRGDVAQGEVVFRTRGTCASCHQVHGHGQSVGPDLSGIGSKLAKEAMYVAILDPSAAISHNYESYAALTEDGEVVVGLLVSRTEDQLVLKDAKGIERQLASSQVEDFKRLEKSLMPESLVEALSADDLVHLVEYLMSLRAPADAVATGAE